LLQRLLPDGLKYAFDMTDVCRTRNKQALEIGFNVQWEIIDMAAFDEDQINHLQKVDTAEQQKNDEMNQGSPMYGLIDDVNEKIGVFGVKISVLQFKTVTVLN
jgi:hypothetical protein